MAYLSLYRKYRPQTFAEILGQDHVSHTLTNAITEDRVAHAYLFTGPRGTGKTSTARILAKALNCEKGPTPSPCGECHACRSIADGSSLDVIEMDAASHSKVDETREILAGVPLATSGGRKKVYVIDEVHMLSTGSFNALLKTLEEPPAHVVFILATTESHKVPATILSRSQRFDFRRVSTDVIEKHLTNVAAQENIDIEDEAVAIIARHAEGGVRDALSALDQLSNIAGRVTAMDAEGLLGLREEDSYFELFDAITAGDVATIFTTMHSLIGQGADPRQLALGILGHARTLLLLRTSPDSETLIEVGAEDLPRLSSQAQFLSVEHLLRVLDLVGKAITDMRLSPNGRLLLEVALVRAAAPGTDPSALGLQGRIERLERRMGFAESSGPDQQTAPQQVPPVTTTPPQAARPASNPRSSQPAGSKPGPASGPAPRTQAAPAQTGPQAQSQAQPPAQVAPQAQPVVQQQAQPAPVPAAGLGLAQIKDAWQATLGEVGRASKRIQALLNPSRPISFDADHLVVEVQSSFHESTMSEDPNRQILIDAVFNTLGIRPSVGFVARGSSAPQATPSPTASPVAPSPEAPVQDVQEGAHIEETEVVEDSKHDPVELIKEGLGAEVIEERTGQ